MKEEKNIREVAYDDFVKIVTNSKFKNKIINSMSIDIDKQTYKITYTNYLRCFFENKLKIEKEELDK